MPHSIFVSPWIALLMCSIVLAGCSRGAAKTDASQVVAQVNGQEISVHQINQVLRRQGGMPTEQIEPASREVLDRLVDQELAVQHAVKLKLDQDPTVMQDLGAARREVLARAYANRLADSAAKPSSEDVRRYYDANPGYFAQRKVYLLQDLQVLATAEQIEQMRETVKSAKSLNDISDYLRKQNLVTKSSQITEAPESLPAAVASRLVSMRDGQALMTPSPGGARILVIAGSKPAPINFDTATPYISRLLESERRRKAVEDGVQAMRKDGAIQLVGKFAASALARAAPSAEAPATAPADGAASGVDSSAMSKGMSGLR